MNFFESRQIASITHLLKSRNISRRLRNIYRARNGTPRLLLNASVEYGGTVSSKLINSIILRSPLKPTSYLEIGTSFGGTLESIVIERRLGVDPFPTFDTARLPKGIDFRCVTSDAFFEALPKISTSFDIVFVDGLHDFRQSWRDLANSLRHLNQGGVVILDDTVPDSSTSARLVSALNKRQDGSLVVEGNWCGDVWKVVLLLSYGTGLIQYRTVVEGSRGYTFVWLNQFYIETLTSELGCLELKVDKVDEAIFEIEFENGLPAWLQCEERETVIGKYISSLPQLC